MHLPVYVVRSVLEVIFHTLEQDVDFLLVPLEYAREEGEGICFQNGVKVKLLVPTNFFQLLLLWPRGKGSLSVMVS